jgi:hypothetical protein
MFTNAAPIGEDYMASSLEVQRVHTGNRCDVSKRDSAVEQASNQGLGDVQSLPAQMDVNDSTKQNGEREIS